MAKKFESINEAQLGFALKILRSQHLNDKSTVFSPVSIATSLALIYLGAEENTATQIKDVLAEGFIESEIHSYFTNLMERTKNKYGVKVQPPGKEFDEYSNPYTSACVLETINRIYFNDDILLKDNFVEKFNNFYQGGIQKVNFLAAETVEEINNFIAEATRNKINNIVGKDSFNELTKIVLINAIYFKGKWLRCFPDKSTKDANFYSAAGKIKKAKMMEHYSNNWRYSETDKFQFLSLPYQESDLSLKIILPRERFGLADIIKNLTAAELLKHLSKNKGVEVIVKIPRFEVKTHFPVEETLKNMGIRDVFEENANLEGISAIKPLFISSILHSAFICTDEKGTEAAAITSITYYGGYGDPPHPPPKHFTADHPFLYLITDSKNNIYFCGTVTGAEFEDGKSDGSVYQPMKEKSTKNRITSFVNRLLGNMS